MEKQHNYTVSVTWTGNKGQGTIDYRAYDRSLTVSAANKENIYASSDTPFLGDDSKHNPETLLLSSLSSCHMLWYLHLCADAGVIVTDYTDNATGIMYEVSGGGGHFTSVTLNPVVKVADDSMIAKANALHFIAREKCFIANSMNFPVHHHPMCSAG